MLRYLLAATTLKAFSCCLLARRVYRKLGNTIGQKKRERLDVSTYVARGDVLVALMEKYGVLGKGMSALELGTGWMHWYGIYARLHADMCVDLFDVWDNRQFSAMKSAFAKVARQWRSEKNRRPEVMERLERLLQEESFDALYRNFGLSYSLSDVGSLAAYRAQQYDSVFSFHVLEHVPAGSIAETISDSHRLLKPGGIMIHQIGIDDHLSHYDKAESPKNYLRYSSKTWKRWFENDVQYHNRLQGADYDRMFREAGFKVRESFSEKCVLDGLPINSEWERYSATDLETTVLTVVCEKALAASNAA